MKKSFYRTQRITEHITAIFSGCGEILYLIEGTDRALLMDTNLGLKELKPLVESLTEKTLDVVLTHGHVDHALGAPDFPRVYLNERDIPLYQSMCPLPERIGYLRANLGPRYEEYGFEIADFVPPDPDYPFYPLEGGQSFDLGSLHVDIYELTGHTPGTMVLFVQEEGVLITGDACNNATFVFDNCCSIAEYQENVCALRDQLSGKIRRVFMCHHVMEAGPELLDNMIDVCQTVLDRKSTDTPLNFMGREVLIAMDCNEQFQRVDGKCGNLVYSLNQL